MEQRDRDESYPPALKQQYVGASEVDIRERADGKHELKHIPMSISMNMASKPMQPTKRKKILDGFILLESSGAHLPADARQATLVDKNLYGVLEEDMTFFTHLVSLDVCENFLDLVMFRGLPKLKELRIACNNMHDIELQNSEGNFTELLSLDLSYNALNLRSVQNLDCLLNLRELDLSGNSLGAYRTICTCSAVLLFFLSSFLLFFFSCLCRLSLSLSCPSIAACLHSLTRHGTSLIVTLILSPSINQQYSHYLLLQYRYRFHALEKLYLDNNKIDDNNIFSILCAMENLRYLSVAYNFLSSIPKGTMDEGMHPLMQVLDLSFNYFGTEDDLQPVIELPRLMQVLLYGNPVLGSTGEDPQYIYIEELVDTSSEFREGHDFPEVDFVTEIPRKRNFKKGQPAGRHATYRDFDVVAVGGDYEAEVEHKTASQGGRGQRSSSSKPAAAAKKGSDWREEGNKTLFAEAIALAQSQKVMSQIPDVTFITESAMTEDDQKVLRIADQVMDQVANEMDLQTSAEILYFQDMTKVRVSDFGDNNHNEDQQQQQGGGYGMMGSAPASRGLPPPARPNVVEEKVPSGLFTGPGRTMADPSTMQTHPVAVQTAMRALQFAINNPLTNYNEVPNKGGLPPHDYVRPTQAALNRQMPRREPSIKPAPEIKKVKNKARRGLLEPSLIAQERRKERDRTLQQIESVLDDLNSSVDGLVLKGPGAHGGASAKDNVDVMKTFARPKTGLRGLVAMVDEVVKDLDA